MYSTGAMYNKGNGLSWARARGHGCLPSVCLCYVHQVQKFVSISKYRVQFFALISVQSTVFCFDLWTKYSTLNFCAGVVLCTLLWCVFIGLTIWWTLNPAFCFPQAPLCGALTILFDPCFQDEGLIFATDFHPILARGRPVDPQSTPNMGQMRSGWGERWPHLFVWLRQFNQSTKQLQIDLQIPILMKTSATTIKMLLRG